MKNDKRPRRVLWCNSCDQPENHAIEYKGTELIASKTHAKFKSECLRCTARHNDEPVLVDHSISVTSYNALMKNPPLYDIATAP